MENAHLRMGKLTFVRQTKDSITHVTLHLERLVAEAPAERGGSSPLHLVSVFGGDQEIGAIAAAAADGQLFQIHAHATEFIGTLGEKPILYRASLQIAGRKRPVRHLVILSKALFETTFGANAEARRTILCDNSPECVLHRLAIRFGLPVLPEWAAWFHSELIRRGMTEELLASTAHRLRSKVRNSECFVSSAKAYGERQSRFRPRASPKRRKQRKHPLTIRKGAHRMGALHSLSDYLRSYGPVLGSRILEQFPPLHEPGDPLWPGVHQLKRTPFPAQALAIMGIVKRWEQARCAAAVAECGTGKTLISLGGVFTHAKGRRFTALAMVPPQLVEKWARECFLTLPGVRVFVIDGVRNGVGSNGFTGVNEVRLRNGRIVREGVKTTLSELRLRKTHRSSRARWHANIGAPSILIVSRERAKLGYFWRHSFGTPRSGPYLGSVVNPDTGKPVLTAEDQLRRSDFRKLKHSETVLPDSEKSRRSFFSPLWQADNTKIARMAPIEFIGRYLGDGFFDYGIADEVHELKGSSAQGNALGTIAAACERTVILTGTLLGGYADDLFQILYRTNPSLMRGEGFDPGESGVRQFADAYGVLEKVTTIEAAENACSKAKVTTTVKRRPGSSPLLFGKYLMNMAAFVSLEDISDALPPYREEVLSVEMDPVLKEAYSRMEDDIREAIREHPGNASVISTAMNALLLYPDRPYGLGTLYGYERNEETGEREKFVIANPPDLDEHFTYAKERRLIEECKKELALGRAVQLYAVYTQKRDVTRRLKDLLVREGIHAEVLTADVPPEQREAWYERHLKNGMQVSICHPKLVMTGLDILACATILFYETGYSTYVLRQASRRSWRIGQKNPVRVGFLVYAGTAQESCLRLMGKKLLVSLAMEGKLQAEGLQCMDEDDDLMTAMARELVTKQGVGEEAATIWRSLQISHAPASPAIQLLQPEAVEEADPVSESVWLPPTGPATQLSLF